MPRNAVHTPLRHLLMLHVCRIHLGIIVLHMQAGHASPPHASYNEFAATTRAHGPGAETACQGLLVTKMVNQSIQHIWA